MRYPDVVDEPTTIRKALTGRSLARFGDGEIKLMFGKPCIFQEPDPRLQTMLKHCVRDVFGPCLPCIPRIASGKSPKESFWAKYRHRDVIGLYEPSRKATYGSAFISRPDSASVQIDTPDYWKLVRSLWAGKDVVLVRGSRKSLALDLMMDAASVDLVRAPAENAFSEFDSLFERLRAEKRRVLLCLGPTATVLAWKLAQEGVHALDLGHVGMFMRKGTDNGKGLSDAR